MHRDQALLYTSSEMSGEDLPKFESHLSDCPDCLERVSLSRAGGKLAKASLEEVPAALLKESLEHLSGDDPAGGGLFSTGLKLCALLLVVMGGYRVFEKWQQTVPMEEAVPVTTSQKKLSMPAKRESQSISRPLSNSRGPARRASGGSGYRMPMPARPLDCSDRAAILKFKRYVWWEFGGGQPHNVYNADRYASCICGNNAQRAGRPNPPKRKTESRTVMACPGFLAGEVSQDQYDLFMKGFMKTAQDFHRYMPISREQAVKLTECQCGAIPQVAQ